MSSADNGPEQDTVCYRHPSRAAFIRCQRCDRYICPDCQRPAAVGFQCPECVKAGAAQTRTSAAPYGGSRSSNPALTTYVLIGINVAVWGLIVATGGSASRWVERLALTASGRCWDVSGDGYYPHATEAACRATSHVYWAPGVVDGAWWQLLTSMFAHVAVLHIAMNMLALYTLGPQVEAVLGRARYLAVYLLSGLAGSVAVYWLSDSSTLGASGAIFGLIGAYTVLAYKTQGHLRAVSSMLIAGAVISVLGGGIIPGLGLFGVSISWQGHLGGFIGGLVVTALIAYAPKQRRRLVQVLGVLGMLLALAALVLARTAILA